MTAPLVTVVTPCYNEEGNAREMYEAIKAIFAALPQYRYEHLFIDNASKDGTARILRELAHADPNVKVILNARNFGHVRSGYYALLQARGDAVIALACDFQDPPELIPEFLARWSTGAKVVLGVKESSDEHGLFYALRGRYYRMLARMADVELVNQATGFGCFDQAVIEGLRRIDDPYPYFRGLIAEIGYEPSIVPFRQPARKRGISSQNFYTLYDLAFLGIVNHSKVPLRLATMSGFALGVVSLLVAFGYLIAKLLFWQQFTLGIAPILIGFFFLTSVQLLFIGILGEYIGSIYTQVRHHPHVFERERLNF
ncbi:MAG: glycosyltransferase family 2 protein [Proteobacteria bacterium]|nr:glycosyltransferase family 2 protein [Pseudomonadota bacterium]